MLVETLDEFAKDLGADIFGVADISPVQEFIREQGGQIVSGYPRSISIGIILLDTIVDQLPHRFQKSVAVNYKHHTYGIINLRLDIISSRISSIIQKTVIKRFQSLHPRDMMIKGYVPYFHIN